MAFYRDGRDNHRPLDSFSVTQLLTMLESDHVQVLNCLKCNDEMSLTDTVSSCLETVTIKPSLGTLILPILHESHFEGFIISLAPTGRRVIHVDSMPNELDRRALSVKIASLVFHISEIESQFEVLHKSMYSKPIQFDEHSCGIWLTAAITSHVQKKPVPQSRDKVFDIVWELLSTCAAKSELKCDEGKSH